MQVFLGAKKLLSHLNNSITPPVKLQQVTVDAKEEVKRNMKRSVRYTLNE